MVYKITELGAVRLVETITARAYEDNTNSHGPAVLIEDDVSYILLESGSRILTE